MNKGKLVLTTGPSPISFQGRPFQWDIASLDEILNGSLEADMDCGLPRSLLASYVQKKDSPQEVKFSRNKFDEDEYCFSVHFRNKCNMRVTFTLKITSGAKVIRSHEISGTEVVDANRTLDVKFTTDDLGKVGQAIKRTNRVSFELTVGVLSGRADSRRVILPPEKTLAKSIGSCLESEELLELADVNVVDKDGGQHSAHRFLLMVRSPVFRATFRHDMLESRTGRVVMDASAEAVKQLLKFVYTDEIDNLRENEELLLEAFYLGALYELPRLQALVETQMKDTLTIDNVAERLHLAVQYNAAFKKDCMMMIKTNFTEIVKTEGWAVIAKDASVMALLCTDEDPSDDGREHEERQSPKRKRSSTVSTHGSDDFAGTDGSDDLRAIMELAVMAAISSESGESESDDSEADDSESQSETDGSV